MQASSSSDTATPAVGLVFNDKDAEHTLKNGLGKSKVHVETPERTAAVWEKLEKSGLCARCVRVPVREANRHEALRCHTAEHCDALEALEHAPTRQVGGWFGKVAAARRPLGESSYGWTKAGSDMYHNPATPRAARMAAGGVLALTEEVCSGRLRSGFAVVRPPGHHACSDRMCGFCFLNSAAMAAKAAVEEHGLSRVLLLDWDVHHGNGSQDIFEGDEVGGARAHSAVRTRQAKPCLLERAFPRRHPFFFRSHSSAHAPLLHVAALPRSACSTSLSTSSPAISSQARARRARSATAAARGSQSTCHGATRGWATPSTRRPLRPL